VVLATGCGIAVTKLIYDLCGLFMIYAVLATGCGTAVTKQKGKNIKHPNQAQRCKSQVATVVVTIARVAGWAASSYVQICSTEDASSDGLAGTGMQQQNA